MQLIQNEGTYQFIKLTLENGEQLETTSGHPFYIQGKGWNVAANLKVGDVLRLYNGTTLVIKTVDTSTHSSPVFNFSVAHNANYFIAKDGVLVHNALCGGGFDPIARRNYYSTRKEAYEAAKKAGKGKEPKHHPPYFHGQRDPHFHPDVPDKPWTPHRPNPHDHYYYPK